MFVSRAFIVTDIANCKQACINLLQSKFNEFQGVDFHKFSRNQHDILKEYIGNCIYGPPNPKYNMDQIQNVEFVYNKIFHNLDKFVDILEISSVIMCRVKRVMLTYNDSKSEKVITKPCFIIRKCQKVADDKEPCCIVLDYKNDIFKTWEHFVNHYNNKSRLVCTPKDGRYRADECGRVKVDLRLGSKCRLFVLILDICIAILASGLLIIGIYIRSTNGKTIILSRKIWFAILFSIVGAIVAYFVIKRVMTHIYRYKRGRYQKIKYRNYNLIAEERKRIQCKQCNGLYFLKK